MSTAKSPRLFSYKDLDSHIVEFNNYLAPLGLFIVPFLLHQYNAFVDPEFRITARANAPQLHDNTVCLLVGSNAHFCGRTMEQFATNLPYDLHTDFQTSPVNCITKYYLKQFKIAKLYSCFGFNIDTLHDFDMIQNRPRLLVQSAGHVAGMAYYYRPKEYGFAPQLKYGCSMHATYAGWFGFRGAFILKDYICNDFQETKPVDVFAGNRDDIQYMLELFNQFDARWRDTIPTLLRYDPRQIEFFETEPSKRTLPGFTGSQKHHEPVSSQQERVPEGRRLGVPQGLSNQFSASTESMSMYDKNQLLYDATDMHEDIDDEQSEELQEPEDPDTGAQKLTVTEPSPRKKPHLRVLKPARDSFDLDETRTPAEMHSFVDDALEGKFEEEAREQEALEK